MPDIFQLVEVLWPLIAIAVLLVVVGLLVKLASQKNQEETPLPFEKKPFVFDIMSELTLYRHLVELFGDRFYIFPQMSYGRLIQVKKGVERSHRNRFDKKIADFVLCDKERAIAQLVIELDGRSHQSEKKIERDGRVDAMMKQIGLPILHLKPSNLDKGFIKEEVEKILASK